MAVSCDFFSMVAKTLDKKESDMDDESFLDVFSSEII